MSGSNPRFAEWYYGPQFRMLAGYSLILSKKNNLSLRMITIESNDKRSKNILNTFRKL
jgi:hypothetical protein